MKNCKVTVKGNIMTITIDLSQNLGDSKSGKNTVIATTAGNKAIACGETMVHLGLNVYKDKE